MNDNTCQSVLLFQPTIQKCLIEIKLLSSLLFDFALLKKFITESSIYHFPHPSFEKMNINKKSQYLL